MQLLSRWWDAYRRQLGLKDFSQKVGRCGIAAIKERGAARWSWWYPSGNRPVRQYLGYCRALVMVSSSIRRQPDLRIQRSGRNGQRDWCMSRVTALSPLWLSASSACHGLLIITVITPLPTKQRDKNARERAGGRQQLLTCRCVSVMLLRSMQNTRR